MSEAIKVRELVFLSGAPPKLKGMRAGMHIKTRAGGRQGYEIDYHPDEIVYRIRQYGHMGEMLATFQVHGGSGLMAELEDGAGVIEMAPDPETKRPAGLKGGTAKREAAAG